MWLPLFSLCHRKKVIVEKTEDEMGIKFDPNTGYVTQIHPDHNRARSLQIKVGDFIEGIDFKPLQEVGDFQEYLAEIPTGDQVRFLLVRPVTHYFQIVGMLWMYLMHRLLPDPAVWGFLMASTSAIITIFWRHFIYLGRRLTYRVWLLLSLCFPRTFRRCCPHPKWHKTNRKRKNYNPKNDIDQLKAGISKLNKKLNNQQQHIDFLLSELKKVKSQLKRSENEKKNEKNRKMKKVMFTGPSIPSFESNEDPSHVLTTVLKDDYNIDVDASELRSVYRRCPHRLQPGSRRMIAEFVDSEKKREVMVAIKKKTDIPRTLFVNEILEPQRNTVFTALRNLKRTHSSVIAGCTTINGNVFAYLRTENNQTRSPRISINSRAALLRFCQDYIGSDVFSDVWQNVFTANKTKLIEDDFVFVPQIPASPVLMES